MKRLVLLALVACRSQPATTAEHGSAATQAPAPPHASIRVDASLPGASAQTIASAVTTPLERALGQIARLERMTSRSVGGSATIRLEFAAGVDADVAEIAVQHAINDASSLLPRTMPSPPVYEKVSGDEPVLRVALESETLTLDEVGRFADDIVAQKLAQVAGVGLVSLCGAGRDEWHVEIDPQALAAFGKTVADVVDEIKSPRDSKPFALGSASFELEPGPTVREVAKVEHAPAVPDCIAFVAGKRANVVTVRVQPGAERAAVRARLDELLPAIGHQLPPGIDVRALPELGSAYELVGEAEPSLSRRIDGAGAVAAHAALVELGIDRDGDPSPRTMVVHGDRAPLAIAARDRMLELHDPGDHVVGFEAADPAQLHDVLAQHLAALRATQLGVQGTLGDDEQPELEVSIDRDRMAVLGASAWEVEQTLRVFAPEGIIAGTIFTQRSTIPIVVTVRDPDLAQLYVHSTHGGVVPLSAIVALTRRPERSVIYHSGQLPWLGIRVAGSRADLDAALAKIALPAGVHRSVD